MVTEIEDQACVCSYSLTGIPTTEIGNLPNSTCEGGEDEVSESDRNCSSGKVIVLTTFPVVMGLHSIPLSTVVYPFSIPIRTPSSEHANSSIAVSYKWRFLLFVFRDTTLNHR